MIRKERKGFSTSSPHSRVGMSVNPVKGWLCFFQLFLVMLFSSFSLDSQKDFVEDRIETMSPAYVLSASLFQSSFLYYPNEP